MIYLLDEEYSENSHSRMMIDIIKNHCDAEIKIIEISPDPTEGEIINIVNNLSKYVRMSDIVVCPWAIEGNFFIDQMFDDLSELCWVVVAAGNFNQDIKFWTPARAEKVITVACLNKSGSKASLSNFSDSKELVWVPGTTYNVGWITSSGTSVSCAVYAAFLFNAIKEKNFKLLINTLLTEYKNKLLKEIS